MGGKMRKREKKISSSFLVPLAVLPPPTPLLFGRWAALLILCAAQIRLLLGRGGRQAMEIDRLLRKLL